MTGLFKLTNNSGVPSNNDTNICYINSVIQFLHSFPNFRQHENGL